MAVEHLHSVKLYRHSAVELLRREKFRRRLRIEHLHSVKLYRLMAVELTVVYNYLFERIGLILCIPFD